MMRELTDGDEEMIKQIEEESQHLASLLVLDEMHSYIMAI
jgi:hypothetical protein